MRVFIQQALVIIFLFVPIQNVTEDKKRVEDQRRMMEEEIADFHRRKAQYEAEKMNSGHHTLTLGKLGKKK